MKCNKMTFPIHPLKTQDLWKEEPEKKESNDNDKINNTRENNMCRVYEERERDRER